MVDILLIDEDVNYIKSLINELSDYNKNIRISACITAILEMENNIDKYNFDIILLESDWLSDFQKYLSKYKNSLILSLSKKCIDAEKLNIPFIYKKDTIENINSKIIEVIKNKMNEQLIRKVIKEELKYLGYNPKYYGTEYLIEAIYILYTNGIDGDDNLKKVVYPVIAKKYNKTIQNIKCNIINSTNIMVCECEENKLLEYLEFFDYSKPGPKKIIDAVLNHIIKEK